MSATALRHAWYDDALAFVTGTLFFAINLPQRIVMSIVGALALNLTPALNHRAGRYAAF